MRLIAKFLLGCWTNTGEEYVFISSVACTILIHLDSEQPQVPSHGTAVRHHPPSPPTRGGQIRDETPPHVPKHGWPQVTFETKKPLPPPPKRDKPDKKPIEMLIFHRWWTSTAFTAYSRCTNSWWNTTTCAKILLVSCYIWNWKTLSITSKRRTIKR